MPAEVGFGAEASPPLGRTDPGQGSVVFQAVGMDDVLNGGILPFRVVFALEVVAEESGQSLPHEGAQSSLEFLDDAKCGAVGLAVNQANQQDAFSDSEPAKLSFEPLLQGGLALGDHGFARSGIVQVGQFRFEGVHHEPGVLGIRPDFENAAFEPAVPLGPGLTGVIRRHCRWVLDHGFLQVDQRGETVHRYGVRQKVLSRHGVQDKENLRKTEIYNEKPEKY